MNQSLNPNNPPNSNQLPEYATSLGSPSQKGLLLSKIVSTMKNEYFINANGIKNSANVYKNVFYYDALQDILKNEIKPNSQELNYEGELKKALIAINNKSNVVSSVKANIEPFEKYLFDNHSKIYEKAFYFLIFTSLLSERTHNFDKREFHFDGDVDYALKLIRDSNLFGYIRESGITFEANFFNPFFN